ncbi:hypothetical protein MTO96_035857, partial [Rhipicephalus appendiculatus]
CRLFRGPALRSALQLLEQSKLRNRSSLHCCFFNLVLGLVLERQNTRCGGGNGPQCSPNQVCVYQRTGLVCFKCPCYGTDRAVCVDKQPGVECGPNSIVQLNRDNSYVCKGCASGHFRSH